MISRRNILQGGLVGAAAAAVGRLNPDFLFTSAHAQAARSLRFLGAEALTGNWDPTTHTNLGQLIVEGYVFGYLTRAPMTPATLRAMTKFRIRSRSRSRSRPNCSARKVATRTPRPVNSPCHASDSGPISRLGPVGSVITETMEALDDPTARRSLHRSYERRLI